MDIKGLFSRIYGEFEREIRTSSLQTLVVRAVSWVIAIFCFCLLIFLCWKISTLAVELSANDLSPTDYTTRIIFPIFVGIAASIGLYLTYKRTAAMEQQTSQTNREITTTAFKDAIDLLGHDKAAVVIGGIHALHKIARDDVEYAQTVADILCSYVRETTRHKTYRDDVRTRREEMPPSRSGGTADLSVQTIIDLLFRNKTERDVYAKCRDRVKRERSKNKDVWWVDLTGAFLCGTALYEADLSYVDLWEADLRAVNLYETDISGADLGRAKMQAAKLLRTQFSEETSLGRTQFQGVHSQEGKYPHESILTDNCMETDFSGVKIEGIDEKESHEKKCKWIIDKMVKGKTEGSDAMLACADLEGGKLKKLREELGYAEHCNVY